MLRRKYVIKFYFKYLVVCILQFSKRFFLIDRTRTLKSAVMCLKAINKRRVVSMNVQDLTRDMVVVQEIATSAIGVLFSTSINFITQRDDYIRA